MAHERQRRWWRPRTPVEELLAGIWCRRAAAASEVGVHDNFFELGGHSLLATQVVSRVRSAMQWSCRCGGSSRRRPLPSWRRCVRAPGPAEDALPPLVSAGRGQRLPLSFAQERLWFLDQLEPEGAAYNMAGAVRLDGALDVAALERSFGEIVRRHEVLRTAFAAIDGEPAQVVVAPEPCHMPFDDLTSVEGAERDEEVVRRSSAEAARPFDLARGPLIRATLLRVSADEHVLVVVDAPHRVGRLVGGRAGPRARRALRGLRARRGTVRCRSFRFSTRTTRPGSERGSRARCSTASSPTGERRWTARRRARAPGGPAASGAIGSSRGASGVQRHARRAARALRQVSRRRGRDALHDAARGVPGPAPAVHGPGRLRRRHRPSRAARRPEIEALIGFFVNTLVLRAGSVGRRRRSSTLLSRVRERALGAYAHQDLPFEKLVEELQPSSESSAARRSSR